MGPKLVFESEITCPKCGFKKLETMPTDACQWFYQCEQCQTLLKPKTGDCCVYCSYGSVPCPPIQLASQESGEKGCC
nr:GDCCVxC domain-containing (seleno)protein [Hahella ganghwensis]